MEGYLPQAFIYLCAAVIAVPVAKRLGLGSVLGYLIAGVIIGPILGMAGSETDQLRHFAELGVIMMLFLVGLELAPRSLWEMRVKLLGLGGMQVILTTSVVGLIAWQLGLDWNMALACGLIFSLSSTAIVLQTLNEKGLLKSDGGQSSFAVLLFQDIAVIPILALLPLLALPHLTGDASAIVAADEHAPGFSLLDGLVGWQATLVTIAVIISVVVGGYYLSRPLFRYIASSRLREIFTATALLLVISIALLMGLVGLSPALGTFLAGVVLANSEFRHELESNIEPFKGVLLGLFFITVGAGIDFELVLNDSFVLIALTLGLVSVKALILLGLSFFFNIKGSDRWLFVLGLAQAGEFGFVLLAFAVQSSVVPQELADSLLIVVALSMLLTPALFIFFEKVLSPRLSKSNDNFEDEEIKKGKEMKKGAIIIAGHGRFGQVVDRMLIANGFKTVVLEYQAEVIEGLRRFGVETFYGDAARPDLLTAAGLREAKMLVVTIDDIEKSISIVEYARAERPDIRIVARAWDRRHVYRLYAAGANDIVRETFDSSVRAGRYALEAMGVKREVAKESAELFTKHDRRAVRKLAQVWDPAVPVFENKKYIALSRQLVEEINQAMQSDKPLDRGRDKVRDKGREKKKKVVQKKVVQKKK